MGRVVSFSIVSDSFFRCPETGPFTSSQNTILRLVLPQVGTQRIGQDRAATTATPFRSDAALSPRRNRANKDRRMGVFGRGQRASSSEWRIRFPCAVRGRFSYHELCRLLRVSCRKPFSSYGDGAIDHGAASESDGDSGSSG